MSTRGWATAGRRGSAIAALLCAVGTGMAPGRASAQPAAAQAGSQVNADAQQLFADGQAATKLNQWDKARTLFQGAWRIQQHWKIAASLGRAELKVGRMRDAAEHLAFALREVPANTLTPVDQKPMDEMLAQARAKVGAVKVSGAPDGAEVMVDGVVVGKAPLKGELFLEPGKHRVGGRREGYVDGEGSVVAVAGNEAGVDLGMVKVPEAKAVGAGAPVAEGAVPPAAGPNKGLVIAGAALAAVGLGMGIGFMVKSSAKADERDRLIASASKRDMCVPLARTCHPAVGDADAAYVSNSRVSTASYVAAGIIGAATLTYALFPRSSKKSEGPSVTVVAGPGIAAVALSGSW